MESEPEKPVLSSEKIAEINKEKNIVRREAEVKSNERFEEESSELKVGDIVRRVRNFVLRVSPDVEKIMSNEEDTKYTIIEVKKELLSTKGDEEEYIYELTLKDNETGDVYEKIDSAFFEIDGKIEKELLEAVQGLIDKGDYRMIKRALKQIKETTK